MTRFLCLIGAVTALSCEGTEIRVATPTEVAAEARTRLTVERLRGADDARQRAFIADLQQRRRRDEVATTLAACTSADRWLLPLVTWALTTSDLDLGDLPAHVLWTQFPDVAASASREALASGSPAALTLALYLARHGESDSRPPDLPGGSA
jgi:hypothetical protein